jgi:predicted metal-binding protein
MATVVKVRETIPRKIVEKVPDDVLQADLRKYRERALELGATDAKIITTSMVLIDERVLGKCRNPPCTNYGNNINCPPHAMAPDLMRKIVNNFSYAVFTMTKVPSEQVAGPEAREKKLNTISQRKNHDMVSEIESQAFFDGYHLAMAFADGSCKSVFCANNDCSAIVPGQGCRFALRARASMEAVGMNAFKMAAIAGWDIYPITASISPSAVPHATKLGLVLIY